jgi:hypothetical protein
MSPTLFLLAALMAAPPPVTPQETFATPDQAAQELVAAAEKFDVEQLKKILGPDGIDLVVTQDAVQDKQQAAAFAQKARAKMSVVKDPKNPKKATIIIGPEDWPGPIPIVEKGGRWSFDTKAGRQEILFRRIGSNELDAIEACRSYCDAQHEYAYERHDGATINQYAQRIISTAGKRDGLTWQSASGTWEGPLGDSIARVIAEGYASRYEPYHGYYFKVLKGQGPAAPMGAIDYVVKGAMIGGFALAATPSDYRVTGVMTFIVNDRGVVYEKDLGPTSLEQFKAMTIYNPDKTWKPVRED